MNRDALNQLAQILYGDLHRIAERQLRGERPNHTLQATALLHEAYVKLSRERSQQFNDETHFLAVASRVMRQVLVDHARARASDKRGQGRNVSLEENHSDQHLQVSAGGNVDPVDILQLNRALESLAREDTDLANLIEMRYFGGMSAEETAAALDRSVHAVRHDLRLAHAWLLRSLQIGK